MTESNFDLRSNIKGKPGSQGTLFQVTGKSALNPTLRWPRGYSPERQAEVHSALKATPIDPPDYMEDEHEPGDYKALHAYAPRVRDTIARSTVPAEHLQGLKYIHGHPDQGTDGTYWPRRRELAVDMNQPEADEVLIHELGHHADAQHLRTSEHAALRLGQQRAEEKVKADPRLQHHVSETGEVNVNSTRLVNAVREVSYGVGEGVADNYMVEHYRTRGRRPQPTTQGAYEKNFTRDRLDEKYPGYSEMRPATPLNTRQFAGTGPMLPGMKDWTKEQDFKRWFQ